ncbi:MAG TPA: class I SAM-dependent methyltransferase [Rhabdochlamydiaceae bacterium]|nr:class I SAM-dependent methyltransferase [Rhabdochlamydiaceae bacterium]
MLLSTIYSSENSLPLMINFDKSEIDLQNTNYASGNFAFNKSPEIGPFFEMLRHIYPITTIIETGTFEGSTTAFFARTFETVHTIDISPHYLQIAQQRLTSFSNIKFHLGSSEKILAQILPALKDQFVLFYLDAHWNEFWPLLDELEEINKTHHHHCIVVIDDVKVPDRSDIPFDAYKGHECSFEYVKEKIENLFDGYGVHYLIPSNPQMRAKLVIIPIKIENLFRSKKFF